MPPAMAIPLAFAMTAATVGTSVYQGEQAKKGQKAAMRTQLGAQKKAESMALSEQRRAEQESRRLNRREPDISTLLGRERQASKRGAGSTLLTGPGGGSTQRTLGQTSLLGGG